MKATTLLERQHRNLQQLCEAVERGSENIRASLLPQLAGDLLAHIAVEEHVFYPAACTALREDGWLRSGRSWHARAREALRRALAVPLGHIEFERALGDLREALELHAEETEELLFPELEGAIDSYAMRQLAVSMMSLYHAKVEAGYVTEDLPPPLPVGEHPPSDAR